MQQRRQLTTRRKTVDFFLNVAMDILKETRYFLSFINSGYNVYVFTIRLKNDFA